MSARKKTVKATVAKVDGGTAEVELPTASSLLANPLPDQPFHRCPCGAKATERATWPHDDAGPAKSHVGYPVEGGHWVLDTCAQHTEMYRQAVGG